MIKGLQSKNPFTTVKFEINLDRFSRYIDCLKQHGIHWVGLKFNFPILWSPLEEGEDEEDFWTITSQNLGYYKVEEEGHSSYNWDVVCLNSPR
jgi:hypothetical protein